MMHLSVQDQFIVILLLQFILTVLVFPFWYGLMLVLLALCFIIVVLVQIGINEIDEFVLLWN